MNIDVVLLIIAATLSIIGLIGCIIPGLPGPPLNYAAMLIIQYVYSPFQTYTLVIYAILTALILVIDYMLPIWFAKKFGATKQGIWGSMMGMILGIIFTPIGMILGLLLGAIIGDLIAGRQTQEAAKSGIATFTGTILAIGLKLIIAGLLTFLVFVEIFKNMF